MLWPSNATVVDRNQRTARARFTADTVGLRSGMKRMTGQISFEDEVGACDLDGHFQLSADDGRVIVIWVDGIVAFRAGANQLFKFHHVRTPAPGAAWPEPGD